MQSTDWAVEHSEALRDYVGKGISFSEIAASINAQFGTDYTRNAAIGRARRMGLAGPEQPGSRPDDVRRPANQYRPRLHEAVERHVPRAQRPGPVLKRAAALQLRCVGIAPRHLSLLDLAPDDCRYPYGGDKDDDPISFCGHARREGSSYCVSHFRLTRGPGTASERSAVPFTLRLVQAA